MPIKVTISRNGKGIEKEKFTPKYCYSLGI